MRVLAVIFVVVLAACTARAQRTEPPTTTVPPPTFHRVDDPSLRVSQPVPTVAGILGASSLDTEWLVVGSMFDPASLATTAAIWHSPDLRRGWTRADIRPVDPKRAEFLADVTRVGATRVAVGAVGHGADADAMVLVYEAEAWSRIDDPDLGGDGEQQMTAVTSGPEGLVAIGLERGDDGESSPRLWRSDDGVDWQLTASAGDEVFDEEGHEVVTAAAGAEGGFVAVGWDLSGEQSDGRAWFSADGRSWERVEVPGQDAARREALLSVTAHGAGFVATGVVTDGTGRGVPASWVSVDGMAWTGPSVAFPQIDDGRSTTSDLTAASVSSDGTTIVAGTGDAWRPHVWTSSDGLEWTVRPSFTEVPDFESGIGLTAVEMAQGALGVLADSPLLFYPVGERWAEAHTGEVMPIVGDRPWLEGLATDGVAAVAVGGRWSPAGPDGTSRTAGSAWIRDAAGVWAATASRLDGNLAAVTRYAGGWVAVGMESFDTARQRETDANPDGSIWTAPDGQTWTRVLGETITPPIEEPVIIGDSPIPITDELIADLMEGMRARNPPYSAVLGGPGTQSLWTVARFAGGFVTSGVHFANGETEPLVVISPDGSNLVAERPGAGPGDQAPAATCVAADGTVLAVGFTSTGDDSDVYAWRRDPTGGWTQATATDGSFAGPRGQSMTDCHARTGGGFVAIGSDGREVERGSDAVVWTSADGLTWESVADPDDVLGGENDQSGSALVELPGGDVLIAIDDTRIDDGDIGLLRLEPDGTLVRADAGEVDLRGRGRQSAAGMALVGSTVIIVGSDLGGAGVWEARLGT